MGIELRNIAKSVQGALILRDLNLTIQDGAFVAIVAPTGSGAKTMLLRIMAGLEKPDKGSIFVDGQDVSRVHVRKRNVAMVYQDFINYPSLSVYENIASPLRVQGKLSHKDIDQRVRAIAEQLRIVEFLGRMPQALSGGQQQRVAIARALIKDAQLVLLNEPLANLDYKLREDLRVELKSLATSRNAIFIYATPEPIDALMMASHTAILHDGKILQFGETQTVYRNPNHIKSGEYFSDPPMNFLKCSVSQGQAIVAPDFKIPVATLGTTLAPGSYLLGIRAHHIGIAGENGHANDSDPHHLTLEATVKLAEIVGSDTTMYLAHQQLEFIALSQNFRHFHLDETVRVSFDLRQIHVFDVDGGHVISNPAEVR
jgi:glycerol transport system ATP-binding protein